VGGLTNATAAGLTGKDVEFGSVDAKLTDVTNATPVQLDDVITDLTAIAKDTIDINGTKLDAIGVASSAEERLGQVVAAINAKTADHGVTAFISVDDAGDTLLELRGTGDVKVTGAGATLAKSGLDTAAYTAADAATGQATAATGGLEDLSIKTQAGAWEALQRIDGAIDQVNAARGDLGALQTRFEKTVENIDIQNENISAARGRIVDADFAAETANLSRSQILQQAGTAMVAQANQLPQNVLSLLR
jgi:flagellin